MCDYWDVSTLVWHKLHSWEEWCLDDSTSPFSTQLWLFAFEKIQYVVVPCVSLLLKLVLIWKTVLKDSKYFKKIQQVHPRQTFLVENFLSSNSRSFIQKEWSTKNRNINVIASLVQSSSIFLSRTRLWIGHPSFR